MKKSDIRQQINSQYIGFDPDRMKTVHVANGLFMEILGSYYRNDLMNRVVVSERRTLPKDRRKKELWKQHASEALLPELGDRLPRGTTIEALNRLRLHLSEHFDADNGVYDRDDSAGCAYSASTHLLITDDRHNDGFSGNFLGYFLGHDFGSGPSPLLSKIRDALRKNSDPLSVMAYIFTPADEQPQEVLKTYADQTQEQFSGLIAKYPELHSLRKCFDRLAAYYPNNFSPQRFLRLVVILGSVVLIRYLMILYDREARLHLHSQDTRLSLLIDAQQGDAPRLRLGSRATYSRFIGALPELYGLWLGDRVISEAQTEWQSPSVDANQIVATYRRIIAESSAQVNGIFPQDTSAPDNLVATGTFEQVARAAGMHMASNMLKRRAQDDFLSGFVRDLGIRCGLVKPRATSQKSKYISLHADTIEVLVLTLIEHDEVEGVTLDEFAERLWDTFGLIFGGLNEGAEDFNILSKLGIYDANQDDLNRNNDMFVARLVSLGLAKEYSDGLVLVQYRQ